MSFGEVVASLKRGMLATHAFARQKGPAESSGPGREPDELALVAWLAWLRSISVEVEDWLL